MSHTVYYAELVLSKLGTTYSSIACLPRECGAIFKLIGLKVMIWWLWPLWPEESLLNIFFAEVVFTAWWNLWQLRNDKIFRHINPTFSRWRQGFVHDISLLGYRIKPRFKEDLFRWIDYLPP